MLNYTLKVAAVIPETEEAVTIAFKQPALKKVNYISGQYLTIVVTINGRKYKRPYSIASSPGIDQTIDVTVKRIPHGIVSNYLNDSVHEGDLLEVIEPLGNFILQQHNLAANIMLWGAGSGITPLFSILKSVLNSESDIRLSLVYANRNKNNIIYKDQLMALQSRYPDRFSLMLFFSKEPDVTPAVNTYYNRLSASDIEFLLEEYESVNTDHYICGPEDLKKAIKDELSKDVYTTHNVFSEDFDHSINEEELEGINTRDVNITLYNETTTLEVVRGKSILEAGLDRGIDLPYSCQNGSCKLCKARLKNGNIKVIGHAIENEGLALDEYLLCCSYPLTENVEVEI